MATDLIDVSRRARLVVLSAIVDLGKDLGGLSAVDLVLDNLSDVVSSADAKTALVAAGIDGLVTARVKRSYSER